jgi:hypothetical protein
MPRLSAFYGIVMYMYITITGTSEWSAAVSGEHMSVVPT